MKSILGKKIEMVQYFTEKGECIPATLIHAEPMTVTQVKTKVLDGYDAVQVGHGTQKATRLSKGILGHTKGTAFRTLKELSMSETKNVGDVISIDILQEGDIVNVRGVSKGKGFQGVVKRHGFKGGRRSHGQKHSEREPGSIGGGLRSRVPKGMRMAGRMGSDMVQVKNLTVISVDTKNNHILVSGAIPGRRGTLLEVIGK